MSDTHDLEADYWRAVAEVHALEAEFCETGRWRYGGVQRHAELMAFIDSFRDTQEAHLDKGPTLEDKLADALADTRRRMGHAESMVDDRTPKSLAENVLEFRMDLLRGRERG